MRGLAGAKLYPFKEDRGDSYGQSLKEMENMEKESVASAQKYKPRIAPLGNNPSRQQYDSAHYGFRIWGRI